MSTETILELVAEVRERIRKALPSVVPADQVERLTETLFTTLTNGGGSFGDPLGGWVTLVSQAFYLGNWLATHKPGDPAPSGSGDKITDRIVAAVREGPAPSALHDRGVNEFGVIGSDDGRTVSLVVPERITTAQASSLAAWLIAEGGLSLDVVKARVEAITF